MHTYVYSFLFLTLVYKFSDLYNSLEILSRFLHCALFSDNLVLLSYWWSLFLPSFCCVCSFCTHAQLKNLFFYFKSTLCIFKIFCPFISLVYIDEPPTPENTDWWIMVVSRELFYKLCGSNRTSDSRLDVTSAGAWTESAVLHDHRGTSRFMRCVWVM